MYYHRKLVHFFNLKLFILYIQLTEVKIEVSKSLKNMNFTPMKFSSIQLYQNCII